MKAAVCYEVNKPLVIEEVDADPPGPGEVKVRLAATSICSSDISIINGEVAAQLPGIIGLECAGIVDETGEDVTSVIPGDHVVIFPASGVYAEKRKSTTPRFRNKKGQPVAQLSGLVGGLCEYTIVSQHQLVKIADDMPLDKSVIISGVIVTGFRAVVNHAQVKPFQSVAVVGCGSIGFSAIQGAIFCGAHPVIAVDVMDERLKIAHSLGATHMVNTQLVKDLEKTVKNVTDGKGVDYAFITRQSIEAVNQGSQILGPRGTEMIVCRTMGEMYSSGENGIFNEIMGNTMMDLTSLQTDIPRYVSLFKAGRLKLDELVTGTYPFEQVNEAIEFTRQGNSLRNLIIF
ncbi:MAG: alcohol dehydrogenase catalytic domain-containing protein [Dehalococcoidales bacterium]|nr:alcohol dehydrogenase catalytic domain-containing protein [Dehalococcoidales bacterium]